MTETNNATPRDGAAAHLVSESNAYSPSDSAKQGRRLVLKDDSALASLGTPRVVVTYQGGEASVTIDRKPWGWENPTRVFLNGASPGVRKYADKLFARLLDEADRQDAYKSGHKARNAAGREAARIISKGER